MPRAVFSELPGHQGWFMVRTRWTAVLGHITYPAPMTAMRIAGSLSEPAIFARRCSVHVGRDVVSQCNGWPMQGEVMAHASGGYGSRNVARSHLPTNHNGSPDRDDIKRTLHPPHRLFSALACLALAAAAMLEDSPGLVRDGGCSRGHLRHATVGTSC
jgi:hypothetical protein